MKTFSSGIAAEIAKKTGIAPIWVLRLTINGVKYDLSDSAYTFPASMPNNFTTTLPWIGSWGQIRESISGGINEILISDFSVSILVDQDVTNNIYTLALTYPLETSVAELYLWFDGLTIADPPVKFFIGYIKDADIPDETRVDITIEDETSRMNKYVGTKITPTDYPLSDPDDVGKLVPIVYGTVSKLPGVCVDSGWISPIVSAISATDTSITVSEVPTYSLAGKIITVDAEEILVGSVTGKVLTVTRAQNSTLAVIHTAGSLSIEKKSTPLVYLLSDHSVDSIGNVYARVKGYDIDITSGCTKYIGTSGNQLAAYPGKGAVTIPDFAKTVKSILIGVDNALSLDQGYHTHPTSTSTTTLRPTGAGGVYGGTGANNWNSTFAQNCWDNNTSTYMAGNIQSTYAEVVTPPGHNACKFYYSTVNAIANCLRIRVGVNAKTTGSGGAAEVGLVIRGTLVASYNIPQNSGQAVYYTGWADFTNMADLYNYAGASATSYAFCTLNNLSGYDLYEIWFEVETGAATTYSSATGVALLGSIGISGNSVSDIVVGEMLLADVTRNITTPFAVIDNILQTYCADATLIQIGSTPSGYTINGAITEYRPALKWIDFIAFQSKAYFRKITGVSKLIFRELSPTAIATIAECCLNEEGLRDLSFQKVPQSDVLNKVKVFYNLDQTKKSRSSESFTASSTVTDSASIAIYGEREQPNQFLFDFVTSSAMALDLATFYCTYYAARKWRISFSGYLDKVGFEFGDIVTLSFLPAGNITGQIVEAGVSPGDLNNMDKINFIVI